MALLNLTKVVSLSLGAIHEQWLYSSKRTDIFIVLSKEGKNMVHPLGLTSSEW
jgi:hypothetical protein